MSYLSMSDQDNEEDFFGSPPLGGQSSNLGSLFGKSAKRNNNQSLTYTAPKPPRSDKGTKDASEKKASQVGGVAAASAITAYRYVNKQYKLQGKLGIALLSNFAERDYKILMYVSKQQPVATAKIRQEFQFNVQLNNYASFYDDQHQLWSVLFDSVENIVNFAKQVCIAKYHCQPQPSVIVQDLLLGENETVPLKSGDLVETKYTGWVVQPQSGMLGAVFDSNHSTDKTFRFKMGKGKVIKGWEEGMTGMKKTGKRFLVIPPNLAYGAKGAGSRVPPNSILAFEVDVLRIKHTGATSSIQGSDSTDSVPQALEQNEQNFGTTLEAPFSGLPTSTPEDNDGSVKGRTASFNEQLAHSSVPTDNNKAKLLSRMARVGHAMLPPQPGLKADPQHPASLQTPVAHVTDQNRVTDSAQPPLVGQNPNLGASVGQFHSVQDVSQSSYSSNPGSAATPGSHRPHPHSDYQQVVTNQMMPQMPVQFMQHSSAGASFLPSGIMSTYSQIPRSTYNTTHHLPLSGADILPSILLESQTNGSKLKSLMEKIDDVSEKVTKLKSASESYMPSSLNQSSMDIMDAAQLSFNIQRIIQENERVKKQILERDKLVQTQSDKITDLLRQNQKLMEESHEQLERRNVSFNERFGQTQEKTLQLEQEKLELTSKLSDATSKICELQTTLTHTIEKSRILEKQVKASSEQNVKATSNEQRVSELETELSTMHSRSETLENENRTLRNDLKEKVTESNMKEQIQLIKRESESEIESLHQEVQNLKIQHEKELHSLQEQFQNESSGASELRARLEGSWKEKCKDAVMKMTKAAEEKLEVINAEKEALLNKLEMFQQKFLQLRGMYEEKVKSEDELKEHLEEFETVKERYDNLRTQALTMKQKYEITIKQLKEIVRQREESADSTVDINTQVKSVMNQVFQQVRAEISPSDEYRGSDVLTLILNAIKSKTLTLLSPGEAHDDNDENESSQDEDEEKIENTEEKDDAHDSQSIEDASESSSEKEYYVEEDVVESITPVSKSQQMEEGDATVEIEDASLHEEKLIPEVQGSVPAVNADIAEVERLESPEDSERNGILPSQTIETLDKSADEASNVSNDEKTKMTATQLSSAITRDGERPDDTVENHHTVDQRGEDSSPKLEDRRARSVSPVSDAKPSPPPLFDDDDDDDDDDLDWLK